jgi:6-phosphogluconolactonase
MIRASLLRGAAGVADLVPLCDAGLAPAEAVSRAGANVAALPRPFAVTLLGLGDDGHTASLFPDSPTIDDELTSDADVVAVSVARLPQTRVSLTPRALLDTREICLLFFGRAKRRVYERALESGSITAMPVRLVLYQTAVPVTIFWAP